MMIFTEYIAEWPYSEKALNGRCGKEQAIEWLIMLLFRIQNNEVDASYLRFIPGIANYILHFDEECRQFKLTKEQ